MGGSSFDWFLQLFVVSLSVDSQCCDHIDHLKLVFFSACKLVILLLRKLKVVSVLNWRREKKGFKRMSNRNFYYSGEERLGGRVGLPNLCAGEQGEKVRVSTQQREVGHRFVS